MGRLKLFETHLNLYYLPLGSILGSLDNVGLSLDNLKFRIETWDLWNIVF